MADITMCDGKGCQLKEKCWRYLAPVNPYRQSYFMHTPCRGPTDCAKFWEVPETRVDTLDKLTSTDGSK